MSQQPQPHTSSETNGKEAFSTLTMIKVKVVHGYEVPRNKVNGIVRRALKKLRKRGFVELQLDDGPKSYKAAACLLQASQLAGLTFLRDEKKGNWAEKASGAGRYLLIDTDRNKAIRP